MCRIKTIIISFHLIRRGKNSCSLPVNWTSTTYLGLDHGGSSLSNLSLKLSPSTLQRKLILTAYSFSLIFFVHFPELVAIDEGRDDTSTASLLCAFKLSLHNRLRVEGDHVHISVYVDTVICLTVSSRCCYSVYGLNGLLLDLFYEMKLCNVFFLPFSFSNGRGAFYDLWEVCLCLIWCKS